MLGLQIYTDYAYPFEIAAMILLVAIIAAIALTTSHKKDSKRQNISEQVKVRAQDRVRIVKMASEKTAATVAAEEAAAAAAAAADSAPAKNS